jgi:hypothetical protein
MVEPGNISAGYITDALAANGRQNDVVNKPAVFRRCARLGLSGGVLGQEPLG